MTSGFGFLPNDWGQGERDLYFDAFDPVGAYQDTVAQALFNEGYFNRDLDSSDRIAIREALDDYMWQEYGVDFHEIFDWEAWRDAYGENG